MGLHSIGTKHALHDFGEVVLDEIKEKFRVFIEYFSTETIASITGWNYSLWALNTVAKIWRTGITII
jgi:hypothetical protein